MDTINQVRTIWYIVEPLNWEEKENNTNEYIIIHMTEKIKQQTLSLLEQDFISDTETVRREGFPHINYFISFRFSFHL